MVPWSATGVTHRLALMYHRQRDLAVTCGCVGAWSISSAVVADVSIDI